MTSMVTDTQQSSARETRKRSKIPAVLIISLVNSSIRRQSSPLVPTAVGETLGLKYSYRTG
jgi:hypothetical protein